ncbi:MAG: hypothetical protein COW71_15085 [Ignavibacteriales bacterium CG18_big_fil_WC_8_21_14_2_50_31_20]|nr:MAG: hypothetical protein COW71_15085 [Ignavibacteriales bacterium CG18_big_fil_WC_8_21_14_2_50_31_20]
MNKIMIIILLCILILFIALFLWQYVFNIYEAKILVNPKYLIINSDSKVVIEVIPLNSFGKKALFRKISLNHKIIYGKDLIKIEKISDNIFNIHSKGKIGNAEILVTPSVGLFSSKIKIPIQL